MHKRARPYLTNTILAFVLLAIVAGTVFYLSTTRVDKKWVTASFSRTVSLYKGSDVKILGITVGQVDSVTPSGTSVTVRFWYDSKYKVPADAKAVIIAPAIVGDRFIQLTPVYESGAVMPDNATMGLDRTAVPLELDQIYQGIDQLTTALGPEGANKNGALSNLINVTAENFAGQGQQFHDAIANFSRLSQTLANNKDSLFGASADIEKFVNALATNDQTVRDFNASFSRAAEVLSGERKDLSAALANLGTAMRQVSTFVQENKDNLSRNIKGLNQLTKILVKQRAALSEALKAAPAALTNLFHAYNNETGTLNNRTQFGENVTSLQNNPAMFLCGFVYQADPSGAACSLIKQALNGAARVAAMQRASGTEKPIQVEHIDKTLGGILAVN